MVGCVGVVEFRWKEDGPDTKVSMGRSSVRTELTQNILTLPTLCLYVKYSYLRFLNSILLRWRIGT